MTPGDVLIGLIMFFIGTIAAMLANEVIADRQAIKKSNREWKQRTQKDNDHE